MKNSSALLRLSGLLSLSFFAACKEPPPPPPPTGGVEFDYVLLFDNAGVIEAAANCGVVNVATVRFAIGDDLSGEGILDEEEEIASIEIPCNQNDADNSGIIDANELGNFVTGNDILADTYDVFSIAFLDNNGGFVRWDQEPLPGFDIISFSAVDGTTIAANDILFLPFQGNNQVAQELQVFVGF